MTTEKIINGICAGCQCDKKEAQEYLQAELRNLSELNDLDDLRFSDIENACSSFGLSADYEEYFIEHFGNFTYSSASEFI